jgi:hypothetical protein
MYRTGEYTIADLAEVFTVSRTTVYRTLQRHQPKQAGWHRHSPAKVGHIRAVPARA